MRKIYLKIKTSKIFKTLKRIIFLDNEKNFLISSLTYYFLISLVPLCSISSYFLALLNIDSTIVLPLTYVKNFNFNNFKVIISVIISIYIASKGILNYFFYLNEKFMIKKFPYSFILSRLYSFLLTIIICFFIAILITFTSFLSSKNILIFNIFKWIINILIITFLIQLINYLSLRKNIKLKDLFLGSFISSVLLNFSSIIYQYYRVTKEDKLKYYGELTDTIILLLFMYLISYFICVGNQINFMIKEKELNNS